MLVGSLRERGVFDGLEELPEVLVKWVAPPAARAPWVPEIVSVAAFLAIRDARYPGAAGELEFLAWIDALNHKILDAELPSVVATPSAAVEWLPAMWAHFHRGTTLTVALETERSAEIEFSHPRFLFPGSWMESRRRTLASVLARSGAVQPEVRASRDDEYGTRFVLSWR
jgi:hypothetical protein